MLGFSSIYRLGEKIKEIRCKFDCFYNDEDYIEEEYIEKTNMCEEMFLFYKNIKFNDEDI
jgi:hypothetical protein